MSVFNSVAAAPIRSFLGIILAFAATFAALIGANAILPRDHGREFAVQGSLSAGKPRGAGVVFVPVFAFFALFFTRLSWEIFFYLLLIVACMLTGYFDDASKVSWGRLKKGLLDLAIAIAVTIVFLVSNGSDIFLPLTGKVVHIPTVLYALGGIALIWMSINVTNCTDGVDGLSGTLVLITLGSFWILERILGYRSSFSLCYPVFMACLAAYLWFNATPSILMMGDSGSRAMGLVIAIAAMTSRNPLVFIPFALVLILDGGLGLLKLALIKTAKIHILKNIRTPLHDHVRKNKGWSNAQVVMRFAIVQLAVSALFLYLVAA